MSVLGATTAAVCATGTAVCEGFAHPVGVRTRDRDHFRGLRVVLENGAVTMGTRGWGGQGNLIVKWICSLHLFDDAGKENCCVVVIGPHTGLENITKTH